MSAGNPSLEVTPLKNQLDGGSSAGGYHHGGGGGSSHNNTRDLLMELGGESHNASDSPGGGYGAGGIVGTPSKQLSPSRHTGAELALQGYSANSPGAIARGGRLPSAAASSGQQHHEQQRGIQPLCEVGGSDGSHLGDDTTNVGEHFPSVLAGVGATGSRGSVSTGMTPMEEAALHSKMQQLHLQGQMALGATDDMTKGGGMLGGPGAGDRRGVTSLGGKKQSDAQLGSARAMARKLSSGSHATTDAGRMVALEEECRALTMQVHNQEKGLIQVNIDWDKSKKQVSSLSNRLDREQASSKDLANKLKVAESQLALTKREMAMVQRQASKGSGGSSTASTAGGSAVNSTGAARAAAQELHQKDLQLKRALEDLEKCQTQLRTSEMEEGVHRSGGSEQKQQLQHLITENKKMDLQRGELLACVRKQAKLIDVLKRQKMHLEAAKLLQITEAEFTKALECNLDV